METTVSLFWFEGTREIELLRGALTGGPLPDNCCLLPRASHNARKRGDGLHAALCVFLAVELLFRGESVGYSRV